MLPCRCVTTALPSLDPPRTLAVALLQLPNMLRLMLSATIAVIVVWAGLGSWPVTASVGLVAHTLISGEYGQVPLHRIQVGDAVWAFNFSSAHMQLQHVSHVLDISKRSVLSLETVINHSQQRLVTVFEVKGLHIFYAGDWSVLTHNPEEPGVEMAMFGQRAVVGYPAPSAAVLATRVYRGLYPAELTSLKQGFGIRANNPMNTYTPNQHSSRRQR
jgi:hypothetical protein